VLRLQTVTTISIDTVRVDNCIVYDIGYNGSNGTYAFINNAVASKINNIYLTRNTFYSIGYGLILHGSAQSKTVQVSDNTFYNVVGDTRYFIDYNTQNPGITSSFTFTNNIIGKTASPAGSAKGIRSTPAPVVTNSYQTTDCVFASNAITGITPYPGNSAHCLPTRPMPIS